MPNNRRITTVEYYKSFASIQGILAGIFGLLPPASNFFLPGRIFPPLGNETVLAQAFGLFLGLAVTFLVFFQQGSTKFEVMRMIKIDFFLALVFLGAYVGVHQRFVRTIAVPSTSGELYVSVGYERTNFATATFGTSSDWEMLRYRGTEDEEIMRLWTTKSIYIARLALLSSYLGLMLSLIAFASFGVLLHARNNVEARAAFS
jgi:hypothetical protein